MLIMYAPLGTSQIIPKTNNPLKANRSSYGQLQESVLERRKFPVMKSLYIEIYAYMHVFCVEYGICRRIWIRLEDHRGLMTQFPQFRIQQSGYCGRDQENKLKLQANTESSGRQYFELCDPRVKTMFILKGKLL